MNKAKYVMIGGFLGAGKTTTIHHYARWLSDQGKKVGIITNDQGNGLFDTAIGKAGDFPVEEISGGCFCCRFNSLTEAAVKLGQGTTRPDVFLAEPVGSCTDLVATVSLPLSQIYGDQFEIAPLSVLLDPVRALRVFRVKDARGFSDSVEYIYKKQCEEAEIIAINKTDLVSPEDLSLLVSKLENEYPDVRVISQSTRTQTSMHPYFQWLLDEKMDVKKSMPLDYDRYGEGEEMLGWLNLSVSLVGEAEFDGNALLLDFAQELLKKIEESEIAHLKMLLSFPDDPYELASVQITQSIEVPHLSHRLNEPLDEAVLLLNLRIEADPEKVQAHLVDILHEVFNLRHKLKTNVIHKEYFRPAQPVPTHRIKVGVE